MVTLIDYIIIYYNNRYFEAIIFINRNRETLKKK